MWMIFYKNSVSLNVYLRLKFFTWCFKSFYLMLTYSNFSKFALGISFGQSRWRQSRWGQNGWSILFTCYMITMKILGIRRDRRPFECTKGTCLFTSNFCVFFATMQYDDFFMTDLVQSLHQMGLWRLHYIWKIW